jgi:hypothetical protein
MPLPAPRSHGLPQTAVVAVPVPDDGLVVYRLLRGAEPRREDFEPDFTRPQAQLRGIPELLWASISTWLERDQALAWSTQRRTWIAQLNLRPDDPPLTRVALTERGLHGEPRPGHVDVWGYSRQLLDGIAEISVTER